MYLSTKIIAVVGLLVAALLPDGVHAASASPTAAERQDALQYIDGRLRVIDPQEAAFEFYLEAQEAILSWEGDDELVRSMAETYRQQQFELEFDAYFTPISTTMYMRDKIWYFVEFRGDNIVSVTCYTAITSRQMVCPTRR